MIGRRAAYRVPRTAYGVQRLLFVAALLPIGGLAQLRLLQVNGTTETPVGASYDAGSASAGDLLDIRFRIKNLGGASTTVQTISVAGTGFKLSAPPLLPYTLATQAEVEFHVSFSPPSSGSFSAALALNTIVVTTIRATGVAAQLQLLRFDGTTETPVGASYDAGSAAPGDTLDIRLRVKNLGAGSATVQTVMVAGAGFKLSPPLLPYTLATQAEVEFHVSFSPSDPGSYSATLALNTIVVTTIHATGVPAALLSVGATQLGSGATADFGQIETGSSVTKTFTLTNPNASAVSVGIITMTGGAFQGPAGISVPLELASGGSASFQITFSPQNAGPAKGTLTLDQTTVNLTGLGLVPPLPKGTIVVSSGAANSAQQARVSIALASASKVAGTGTLAMQFIPAAGMPDDAAIQFLSGARRSATVTITPGDSSAKLGGQPDFAFQTGTTAGSIVFTLTFPNSTDQYILPIAPAMVGIDTATGARRVNDLDVNLAGFDNTHSISQLGFTFYDTKGSVIQPGMIRIVSPPEFKQYFAANQAGGAFTMRASFPVTGDATQISGVDVHVTNSAGTTSTQRIRFP